MSAPDTKPKPPPEFDSNNRHIVHFYDDGNIMLDVQGMFFQVHKSILKLNSQTFRDMFSLPLVTGPTGGLVETVTLHDDPHTFAKLLDALYGGVEFLKKIGLKQCLEVVELTQKYEMVELEKSLQDHLEQILPVTASHILDDLDRYRHYLRDRALAPLVLRIGGPKLLPWAFYAFGVHLSSKLNLADKATYGAPPELATVDGAYTYPLIILEHLVRETFEKWNTQTAAFFENLCHQYGCSRNNRQQSVNHLRLSSAKEAHDIVMWTGSKWTGFKINVSSHGGPYHGWCNTCVNSLSTTLRNVSLEIYPCLVECVAQLKGSSASGNNL